MGNFYYHRGGIVAVPETFFKAFMYIIVIVHLYIIVNERMRVIVIARP